ncbi:hypothetical protein RYX36_004696 [Vicia faba]
MASVDAWLFIDTAISVASLDDVSDLKQQRDEIVERLYAATTDPPLCQNCEGIGILLTDGNQIRKQSNPRLSHEQNQHHGGGSSPPMRNRKATMSEDSSLELLQNLVDIDITFQELKETDIGRNVNHLRKYPFSDVRRLVKLLVK